MSVAQCGGGDNLGQHSQALYCTPAVNLRVSVSQYCAWIRLEDVGGSRRDGSSVDFPANDVPRAFTICLKSGKASA
jgi:hypothetical protein